MSVFIPVVGKQVAAARASSSNGYSCSIGETCNHRALNCPATCRPTTWSFLPSRHRPPANPQEGKGAFPAARLTQVCGRGPFSTPHAPGGGDGGRRLRHCGRDRVSAAPRWSPSAPCRSPAPGVASRRYVGQRLTLHRPIFVAPSRPAG